MPWFGPCAGGYTAGMEQSEQPTETSPEPATSEPDGHEHKASLRQLLHWATGDRHAEAKALAKTADGPVSEEDANRAVQAAHGDIPSDKSFDDSEVATPRDAAAVQDDSS